MDDDSFFELLSRFQSKRMDDQRCTLSIDSNKDDPPDQPPQRQILTRREGGSLSSNESTNGTTNTSDSGASESYSGIFILLTSDTLGAKIGNSKFYKLSEILGSVDGYAVLC